MNNLKIKVQQTVSEKVFYLSVYYKRKNIDHIMEIYLDTSLMLPILQPELECLISELKSLTNFQINTIIEEHQLRNL